MAMRTKYVFGELARLIIGLAHAVGRMEVVNARSALLSNYEVLTLLRELESEHIEQSRTALRVKKEEETSGKAVGSSMSHIPEVSENLRTVEVEALQYLTADYMPTTSQTPAGITKLVKDIAPYGLTKAEKLQVVNLAPTLPVELYVIVEELEDRLGDRMEEILDAVKASVDNVPSERDGIRPDTIILDGASKTQGWDQQYGFGGFDEDADAVAEEDYADDGDGAGVEGDLEMDED